MSSMTAAQAAQQQRRDTGGRYTTAARGEVPLDLGAQSSHELIGTVAGRPDVNRYRIGVSSNEHPDVEWRNLHEAPTNDGYHAPAHDLEEMMPDIYDQPHLYRFADDDGHNEALRVITRLKGRPDEPVTIYRAVPEKYADQPLRPGDWVSPSMACAVGHGGQFEMMGEKWAVVETEVPAGHLYNEGYPTEFGYDPR